MGPKVKPKKEKPLVPHTDLCEMVTIAILYDNLDILQDGAKSHSKKEVNAHDRAGMTALHFAVAHQKVKAVNILLDNGADVNVADDYGFTPLFLATGRYANCDVASTLLQRSDIQVNRTNYSWATPLHGAAHAHRPDCVRLLIRHGAGVDIKSRDGATPLDLAGDHMETITALKTTRCAECGEQPLSGLKTCGQCQGPLYCSKECQRKHWRDGGHKKECGGFVWAYPHSGAGGKDGWICNISHKDMKVTTSTTSQVKTRARNFPRNKRFLVKVQLPLGTLSLNDSMMVYDKERIITMLINPEKQAKAFNLLTRKICTEGIMGVKGFFWAELPDSPELKAKIYYRTLAPPQDW